MKIDSNDALTRMAELQVLMSQEDETDYLKYCDEYRALLETVKTELAPLVQQMIKAGLFTVLNDDTGVGYEVNACFDNGNFWLPVSEKDACMWPAPGPAPERAELN